MKPSDGFAYAMGTYSDLHSYQSLWYEFGDSERQWRANCDISKNYNQLQRLGWLNQNVISYHINDHGFRESGACDRVDLAVFGDSYTFGVGLPYDCLWHSLIGQHRHWQVANFGVAGAASRTCYRLARHWLPLKKPRYAIFLLPHSTRLEIATESSDGCMTTPYLVSHDTKDDFLRSWWYTDFNAQQERDITQQALSNVCGDLGIPVLFFTMEFFERNFWDREDRARDLKHGGRNFQKYIAQYIEEHVDRGQWN